jgi:hypothetical protein
VGAAAETAITGAVAETPNFFFQNLDQFRPDPKTLLESKETSGKTIFLIIDEAQNLTLGVLEQLRLLSNLETSKRKLLQIIFVGQLEFEAKLRFDQEQAGKVKDLYQYRMGLRYLRGDSVPTDAAKAREDKKVEVLSKGMSQKVQFIVQGDEPPPAFSFSTQNLKIEQMSNADNHGIFFELLF